MLPRLKTSFWVSALIRRLNQTPDRTCHDAVLLKRGDEDAGTVLVVLHGQTGPYAVLREGRERWQRHIFEGCAAGRVEQSDILAEVEAYLERQKRYDPDLWIIEINGIFPSASSSLFTIPCSSHATMEHDDLGHIEEILGSRYNPEDGLV